MALQNVDRLHDAVHRQTFVASRPGLRAPDWTDLISRGVLTLSTKQADNVDLKIMNHLGGQSSS